MIYLFYKRSLHNRKIDIRPSKKYSVFESTKFPLIFPENSWMNNWMDDKLEILESPENQILNFPHYLLIWSIVQGFCFPNFRGIINFSLPCPWWTQASRQISNQSINRRYSTRFLRFFMVSGAKFSRWFWIWRGSGPVVSSAKMILMISTSSPLNVRYV